LGNFVNGHLAVYNRPEEKREGGEICETKAAGARGEAVEGRSKRVEGLHVGVSSCREKGNERGG